jgi:acetylglutamate kinase
VSELVVAKIGGSTLGRHDTTLDDIAELWRREVPIVVVHGGGAVINEWLERLAVPTKFERGLRVTDAASLDAVVGVLAGIVNKSLVASLWARGVPTVGLSGADGGMLRAEIKDPALGFVGEIAGVDASPIIRVMMAGGVPVIAPIAVEWKDDRPTGQLLNINADTAAGAIGKALPAGRLIFMTEPAGVLNDGTLVESLDQAAARDLIASGVIAGGMIPKVEACLLAAGIGCKAWIVEGGAEHSLLGVIEGAKIGTSVG